MTYRHYIQKHILKLSDLFDESSPLRDVATLEEKLVWNKYRERLNDCMSLLRRLDNRLPDGRVTWTYLQDLQRQIYSLQGEIRRLTFEVKCQGHLLGNHGIL